MRFFSPRQNRFCRFTRKTLGLRLWLLLSGILGSVIAVNALARLNDANTSPSRMPSSAIEHPHKHPQVTPKVWRSPGKPSAPLQLASSAMMAAAPQETTLIPVTLVTHSEEGEVTISLHTSADLLLIDTPSQWHFTLGPSAPLFIPVYALAETNGVHHVHLVAEHTDPLGEKRARAFAIEVRAGMGLQSPLLSHYPHALAPHALVPDTAQNNVSATPTLAEHATHTTLLFGKTTEKHVNELHYRHLPAQETVE